MSSLKKLLKNSKDNNCKNVSEYLMDNIDQFSEEINELYSEKDLMNLLLHMLIPIGRNGFKNEERKLKLFY